MTLQGGKHANSRPSSGAGSTRAKEIHSAHENRGADLQGITNNSCTETLYPNSLVEQPPPVTQHTSLKQYQQHSLLTDGPKRGPKDLRFVNKPDDKR